jgi:hypothetical protein
MLLIQVDASNEYTTGKRVGFGKAFPARLGAGTGFGKSLREI